MVLEETAVVTAHETAIDHAAEIEHADRLAERRLVRRIVIANLIMIPLGAGFFALLVFAAVHIGGSPAGAPTAMGAGTGALAGIFFGTWAGVVASVSDMEHVEHAVPDEQDGDRA